MVTVAARRRLIPSVGAGLGYLGFDDVGELSVSGAIAFMTATPLTRLGPQS